MKPGGAPGRVFAFRPSSARESSSGMILSPMDYIECGHGKLYSAPFHSRCLLFRFYHEGCALLIHHEKMVFSGPSKQFVDAHGVHHHVCSTTCKDPGGIQARYSPFASAEVSAIREEPHLSFAIGPETTTITHPFEKVTMKIESGRELTRRMWFTFGDVRPGPKEFTIADAYYRVRCPSAMVTFGDRWTPDAERSVWRIEMTSNADGEVYDILQSRPWSLSAFNIEDGWSEAKEFLLEPSSP
jgi:hypothetical protein